MFKWTRASVRKKATVMSNLIRTCTRIQPRYAKFKGLTAAEIARRLDGLDSTSVRTAQKYVRAWQIYRFPFLLPRFVYPWLGLCSREDYKNGLNMLAAMQAAQQRYFMDSAYADVSALYYHHGLRGLPAPVLQYAKGKLFVDAGAYLGDSTLCFLDYSPGRVIAFEPSPSNQRLFRETMARSHIPSGQVELIPKGLSDQEGEILFFDTQDGMNSLNTGGNIRSELTTLDAHTRNGDLPVGVIKADLEGMGLSMLRGALETIQRDLPILTLSIYHNQDELFGIYELLRTLNLDYIYSLEMLCLPWNIDDLTLIGIPQKALACSP